MAFLAISPKNEDSSTCLKLSDRQESGFDSDPEHREMTLTYASDDYLSKWLPSRKHENEVTLLRREKSEKLTQKESVSRLFKSSYHHLEGTHTIRDTKTATRKTYFQAIQCSPIKLRQSLTNFKRPKLDVSSHNTSPNATTSILPKHTRTIAASQHLELMENPIEKTLSPTKTPQPSLGIVEMQTDEKGELGSLCFKKRFPGSHDRSMYTPPTMTGGKLRTTNKKQNDSVTSCKKNKELLIRCESIMIYPKVLVNPKSNNYKKIFPKEAWKDTTQLSPQQLSASKNCENTTLPELVKDQRKPQKLQQDLQSKNPKVTPPTPPDINSSPLNIPANHNLPATKIIIPFGENEFPDMTTAKASSFGKGQEARAMVETSKKEKAKGSIKKAGEGNSGGISVPTKSIYLKESSKLNERRHSDIVLGVKHSEIDRKQPLSTMLSTQYLTSKSKKLRFPAAENEIFVGRENYPPRKTLPCRYSYGHSGAYEYTKEYDGLSMQQDDKIRRQKISLAVGGTGLFRGNLGNKLVSEELVEGKNNKSLQFLLQKSRYFM